MSENCPFGCGNEAKSREDVLPTWLMKKYRNSPSFTIEVDGQPLVTSAGVIERRQLDSVILEVCESCNGWLNSNFEESAKPAVRSLLTGERISRSGSRAVARWAAKTGLLYFHPDTRHPATDSDERRGKLKRQRWSALGDCLPSFRKTGSLPSDYSVWMWVANRGETGHRLPVVAPAIAPARTCRVDGAGGPIECRAIGFGFQPPDGRSLQFEFMSHPLLNVSHPYETDSSLARIWPDPPAYIDISEMPALGADAARSVAQAVMPASHSCMELGKGERRSVAGFNFDNWSFE